MKSRAGRSGASIASQRGLRAALLAFVWVLFPVSAATAQVLPGFPAAEAEESAPAADATKEEAVAARLAATTAELEATEQTLSGGGATEHGAAARDQLEKLVGLLEAQLALAKARAAAKPADLPTGEPSSFALNELYEARFASESEAAARETAVDAARGALAAAKERLERSTRDRRAARTALEGAGPVERPAAERALESRGLALRIAQETVHLRTLETRAAVAAREAASGIDPIDAQIQTLRETLARGEGDSNESLARLAEREGELRRRKETAERQLATAEVRLRATQDRFSRMEQSTPEGLREIEALTAQRDAIQQQIALAGAQLERLLAERELWRRWETLLSGGAPEGEELAAWEQDTTERLEALQLAKMREAGRLSDLELRLERLGRRLDGEIHDSRLRGTLEAQAKALRQLRDALRADATALAAERRFSERVLAAIHEHSGRVNPLEYAARAAQTVRDVWAYEIAAVDDAPITVGSLVLALVLFGAGLWAARRGSAVVAQVSEERFKLDAGASHALRTLSFYGLLVAFSLLALRSVHFPLTAFTVIGGALAIGVGFGSQNVMNNFISGLILMLERPVRARDVVEVDGNHGTIENIGARSTQIRSTDGRHIIVPNSFFLENNVVNWTLSDDLMRAKVSVGVIYGSPTRLVEERLRQVVQEDDQILKQPDPIIIFEEFGDNSLNFDVYFWVNARSPMQMRKVQSRVRFRIDDLFREDGLVIAFPQRDVHLDSAAPIEVRVVDGSGSQQSPGER